MRSKVFAAAVMLMLTVIGNIAYASDICSNGYTGVPDNMAIYYSAEYQGVYYFFELDFVPNSPEGLYWKLDSETFRKINTKSGTHVGDDLALQCCVSYKGGYYSFILKHSPYPDDTSGLYWKMDTSTVKVVDMSGTGID